MSMLPKISIITPSFNQGHFIEETILSVLEQGYPNLEYIIIDGGSTDNTVEVIKKYEKHLAFWVSEKDRGQSHAINKGLKYCTGEMFNWINSDDYFEKGIFLKLAKLFENPNVKMVCGTSRIFGGAKEWYSQGTKLPNENSPLLHPSIDQPATFFRMDAVRSFGPLTESLHYTMDLEWLLKFWFNFGYDAMLKSDELLAHFREHPNSKTVNFQEKFTNERILIYNSILSQLGLISKQHLSYKFEMPEKLVTSVELIEESFSRFIYFRLQELYGEKRYKQFLELYSSLPKSKSDKPEYAIVKRQKRRAQLLSKFISKD